MFIQTETTPNPEVLKFLPGREVTGGESAEFADIEAASLYSAGEPILDAFNAGSAQSA